MYNDWFSIGPLTVHGYGFFMGVGLIAAMILCNYRAKKLKLNDDILFGIVIFAAIFGVLGAKIMFILVEWKSFIKDPLSFIASSGFVVYGGITLGFAAVIIYCRLKKVKVLTYLDAAIPAVPFAQAFGRIGCFMAGCCYGKRTDSWIGIAFSHSDFAPNNVKLIPTQLISAAGDFLICLILLLVSKKNKKSGVLCSLYVILYSIGRFLIEFLRGDEERGNVGVLSTSQFYGIFCVILGIALFVLFSTRKEKAAEAEASVSEEKNEEV